MYVCTVTTKLLTIVFCLVLVLTFLRITKYLMGKLGFQKNTKPCKIEVTVVGVKLEGETLANETELKEIEIARYRKALVSFTAKDISARAHIRRLEADIKAQRAKIKTQTEEIKAQVGEIAARTRLEDQRFGSLMRVLSRHGIQLSKDELDDLTPD